MASPFGNTGITNGAICLEGLVFICTLSSDNLISYALLAGNLRQTLRLNLKRTTHKSSSETTSAKSFCFKAYRKASGKGTHEVSDE